MNVIDALKKHIEKELDKATKQEHEGPKKGPGQFTVTYKARIERDTLSTIKEKIEEFEDILS